MNAGYLREQPFNLLVPGWNSKRVLGVIIDPAPYRSIPAELGGPSEASIWDQVEQKKNKRGLLTVDEHIW